VLRIRSIAAELVRRGTRHLRHHCAAPQHGRVRRMFGGTVSCWSVDAPVEVCERRDVKGLYAQARRAEIVGLTGLDDPFEIPDDADVRIDTSTCGPDEAAARIISRLVLTGLIPEPIPIDEAPLEQMAPQCHPG
jgi:adenylylsulfate kinase-like enzyme